MSPWVLDSRVSCWIGVASLFLLFSGCGNSSGGSGDSDLRSLLNVPEHMELPPIPEFNPPTPEKIRLGRFLFYDKRLSGNKTQSCASCHHQELAFADGKVTPRGSTGTTLMRNSQGLGNAMYHATLSWSNNALHELEDFIEIPILSDNPVELGVTDNIRDEVLTRFEVDPLYQEMFQAAFPDESNPSEVTVNKIIFALASFCRTLVSGRSRYDKYVQGDESALTEQEKRGLKLFNGEKFECFHCHNGVNFSVSYRDNGSPIGEITFPFFNNGLYNIDGQGSYPPHDQGLYNLTFSRNDRGLFRPQSLRNVELTAPYMHDGSIATLREVLLHYARGGRKIDSGPYAGDGRLSPIKSGLVRGFAIDEEEIDAVIAFLESLTDHEFITDPRFSDPFQSAQEVVEEDENEEF